MKIFLTGGTGFVGSHFINHAHQAGHEIIALKRPRSLPRVPLNKEPEWIEGALDADYRSHLASVDALVHLASHTPNPPYDSLERCLYWNVDASIKLASDAIDLGVKNFLVAGSCFEYGNSAYRYEKLTPETPLEPMLSYPTSKAAASIAFLGLAREKNIKLRLMRIFQVYGEGEQESRLWPSLRKAALEGKDFPMSAGEQVRDFINVTDVAIALVDGLRFNEITSGVPVIEHIATGNPQSLIEFAQEWWSRWGATGKLLPGLVPYRNNEMMRIVSGQ